MKRVRCRGCGKATRLLDGICWDCVASIENPRREFERAKHAENEQRSEPTQQQA